MSKLKHTPGPWIDGNTLDSIIVKTDNPETDSDKFYGGEVICESVAKRNKPIIKAAPEMFEALKDAYKELDALWDVLYGKNMTVNNWHLNGDTEPVDSFFDSNSCDALNSIKSAIESATGMSIEEVLNEK